MKRIGWSPVKAKALREDSLRGGVSFEDCVVAMEEGHILADLPHPNPRYALQRLLVLNINGYAYAVPYVEDGDELFLKTVFPSRKLTAFYLKDGNHDE
jgi:hypothetical protein